MGDTGDAGELGDDLGVLADNGDLGGRGMGSFENSFATGDALVGAFAVSHISHVFREHRFSKVHA